MDEITTQKKWRIEQLVVLGIIAALVIAIAVVLVVKAQANYPPNINLEQLMAEAKARMLIEDRIYEISDGKPLEIVFIDHKKKIIHMVIGGWMTGGSDSSCQRAAELFVRLAETGYVLDVQGSFVPSSRNPIDLAWARYLAEWDQMGRETADK